MYYESLAVQLFEKIVTIEHDNFTVLDKRTRGETFALLCLKKRGGSAFSKELSNDMNVSTARTAAIINSLEQKELVKREPYPKDGRKTIIRLLPRGEERFSEVKRKLILSLTDLFRQLGPDDANEYVRLQIRLSEIIRENRRH